MSNRRRQTSCSGVAWARGCVKETATERVGGSELREREVLSTGGRVHGSGERVTREELGALRNSMKPAKKAGWHEKAVELTLEIRDQKIIGRVEPSDDAVEYRCRAVR